MEEGEVWALSSGGWAKLTSICPAGVPRPEARMAALGQFGTSDRPVCPLGRWPGWSWVWRRLEPVRGLGQPGFPLTGKSPLWVAPRRVVWLQGIPWAGQALSQAWRLCSVGGSWHCPRPAPAPGRRDGQCSPAGTIAPGPSDSGRTGEAACRFSLKTTRFPGTFLGRTLGVFLGLAPAQAQLAWRGRERSC